MVNSRSSVFLYVGSDNYSKEKAIADLTNSIFGASSKELDYRVFRAGESDIKEIIEYVATVPFLASKRLAVIRNAERLPEDFKSRLADYMKKPYKSSCLLLESEDDKLPAEYADISGYITVRRFGNLTDSELLSWVKRFLADRGKKIESGAFLLLKELQGRNMLSLSNELDKLASFSGGRKDITISDVEAVAGKSLIVSAFDLTRAIGEKKISDALKVMSDLTMSGKKHYEIIGLLCWHLKRILRAKTLQRKGENNDLIAGILRINRAHAAEFFRQVESFTQTQIRDRMKLLLEADLDIKRTKFDPALILEFTLIRLCLS